MIDLVWWCSRCEWLTAPDNASLGSTRMCSSCGHTERCVSREDARNCGTCDGEGTEPCWCCGGSGDDYGETCIECQGTGLVDCEECHNEDL